MNGIQHAIMKACSSDLCKWNIISCFIMRSLSLLQEHDDVIKWKHFPRYCPFVREFTGHRWIPLTKASDAELWCFLWSPPWINGWVNNREAGGLRRHHAHYDVTIMKISNDKNEQHHTCIFLIVKLTHLMIDSFLRVTAKRNLSLILFSIKSYRDLTQNLPINPSITPKQYSGQT